MKSAYKVPENINIIKKKLSIEPDIPFSSFGT